MPTYLPAWRYGGLIGSVHSLCKSLVLRGHLVEVFTTTVDGQNDLDVMPGASRNLDGVMVSYFRSPTLRRLYWSPSMRRALRTRIRSFDVVHLHSVFLWPTAAAAAEASRGGVPYVIAPRGMLVPELIRRKNRWAKTGWIHLIEKRNLRRAAAIHFTSHIEMEDAGRLGVPLPHPFIVPNGVDPPFAVHRRPEQALFLFLGRINWKKRLDVAIRAVAGTPAARLKIVGNDEEHIQPELQRLAQQLGVERRIEFAGPVYGEEKTRLFETATALVLPSFSENFGNVVLEAMASACPVIVTPEVGLSETVRREKAGLVVPGDASAFAEALSWMVENGEEGQRMGDRGREAVQREFTWDQIGARMEAEYRRLIQ